MDILKAFSLYDKEYHINIQGTLENPLFQANQIGKLLEMKKIYNQMCKLDNSQKVYLETGTLGGIQKVLFLTESGLYIILSRSNKPIAKVFQNWMVNVIKELRKNGEYKLKEENEIEKKLIKAQEQNIAKKNIHNSLMEFCKSKNVVYICKLHDEPHDKFIIKIGSSQNIKERFANISNDYKMTPLLLNIFDCENHTKFEKWIRNNEDIKSLYFPIKKEDGVTTRETYLVNEEQYNIIIKILQKEIKQFTKEDVDKLLELEKMKFETEKMKNINNKEILELKIKEEEIFLKQQEMNLKLEEIRLKIKENEKLENTIKLDNETTEIIPEDNTIFIKTRDNVRSPKVYQYNPITFELIQIYDSIINFTRHFNSSSGSALREAAKNNTIYKDYRWLLLDRNKTDIPILPPTVETRTQSVEFIAMIDIKQTKILEVYPSQKEAAMARNLAGFSTISRAIKQKSISSGHYWNIFNHCSQEMQDEFLKTNKLPEPHIKANGITVIQINPITNKEIKTYKSITEVLKRFQMSRISLNKASENNEMHNGYKWKVLK
jgi:prophage antirepressor-like protein